jgi:hypothetical protein
MHLFLDCIVYEVFFFDFDASVFIVLFMKYFSLFWCICFQIAIAYGPKGHPNNLQSAWHLMELFFWSDLS